LSRRAGGFSKDCPRATGRARASSRSRRRPCGSSPMLVHRNDVRVLELSCDLRFLR
jgi:hypothetical protein